MSGGALPDLRDVRRLLILRLSSIGDVVHAVPVSAALKEAFPHIELTWIVEEMSAPIVLGNPYLHDVIVIPRSRWKRGRSRSPLVWREYLTFLWNLRQRRFDVTLDLHGFAKTGIMALATGAPHRLGWWRLREGANLASRMLPHRAESVHRVDWFLDVVRALGVEPNRVQFPLFIPEDARSDIRQLLTTEGFDTRAGYIVMNPSGGDPARRWGVRQYAELAARIAAVHRLPTALIGSEREIPACDKVVRLAREAYGYDASQLPLVSLAGKTDLKQLAALLDGCTVHICGDTGSTHIAAALERPVIGLYGPTDPAHAGPWGQDQNVLSRHTMCLPGCLQDPCVRTSQVTLSQMKKGPLAGRGFQGEIPEMPMACCLQAISVEDVIGKVECVLHGRQS